MTSSWCRGLPGADSCRRQWFSGFEVRTSARWDALGMIPCLGFVSTSENVVCLPFPDWLLWRRMEKVVRVDNDFARMSYPGRLSWGILSRIYRGTFFLRGRISFFLLFLFLLPHTQRTQPPLPILVFLLSSLERITTASRSIQKGAKRSGTGLSKWISQQSVRYPCVHSERKSQVLRERWGKLDRRQQEHGSCPFPRLPRHLY